MMVMLIVLMGFLINLGMGVVSFYQGYGEKLLLMEYFDIGIEYECFYWCDLEFEEGKYYFVWVDDVFKYVVVYWLVMNVGL